METVKHKGKRYDVEYSIVNVSELDESLRLDPRYYRSDYVENERKIKKGKWDILKNIFEVIRVGKSPKEYSENGKYAMVKPSNLINGVIDTKNLSRTNEEHLFKTLKYDILVASTGSEGSDRAVAINLEDEPLYVTSELIVLRNCKINPYYVVAYLQSPIGQKELERQSAGSTRQLHLTCASLAKVKIPIPPESVQKSIVELVLKTYEEWQKVERSYKQAKETLLKEFELFLSKGCDKSV